MASSGKFDLSSSSPGRPIYTSGKRGSHTVSSMDRSSSFRENIENPILSSLPSMSRSTMNVSQGDVTNFFQCLRFDLKSMAAEYKCNRYGDYKRLANAALCGPDDSLSGSLKGKLPSFSPEDLKRLKVGLRESTIKARERVKVFSEVLSVINKCFPSIPSRKRSRPDAFSSGDRSNLLLADRTSVGVTVGKMGTPNHALNSSAFEYEQQKVEERGKNVVPNKRTRTSMVDQRADVRPNTPARSSGSVDRDREVVRLPNGNTIHGAERALPIVGDGWEKAKMKKKRSGIKTDAAPSTSSMLSKPIDGTRQGMHPRSLPDARSRLNDPHDFRLGGANGFLKADSTSQQASMGMRSSIPRPEQESTSFLHDKTTNLEQDRTNVRALNKANLRDDYISGTSNTAKLHPVARGPRSGSVVVPKSSHVQRPTVSNGLEPGHGTSKNPGAISSTNHRKRSLSTRSSSPPVAQWADRRPQKMSRTARRTNLVPVVSTNDQVPGLGDITVSEKGRGFGRRFTPVNSPKQFKSKGNSDHVQSSTLSESEESGAAEIRSRDNGSKSEEVEDKSGLNVQKMMSALGVPTRKNKFMNDDDLPPGASCSSTTSSRPGRTGRGFASARSVANVVTAKQLTTARVAFEKPESKIGRPPTRKLSGRTAYTRQKHSAFTTATDFLDDGHEELLAAANAVINPDPGRANSSPIWRKIDPLFGFVSDAAMTLIKQEASIRPATVNPVDSCDTHPNGSMSVEPPKNGTENSSECSEYLTSGTSPSGVSLCQRLLAALISEEDNDEYTWCGNDELKYKVYESNTINRHSFQSFEHGGSFSSNYRMDSTLRSMGDTAEISMGDHCYNGLLSDPAMSSTITSSEYQYGCMSMDERLLIEIHSLGLHPTHVPDLVHTSDEDVSKDISRLEEKHYQQVSRKRSLLDKLLKSIEEARELDEKEFERLSLEKLTGMAYQKYMSCWGPNAHIGKSASGKMAKQAALDFVKRTLDRCHEFEVTGKSCFSEPLFRGMFLSGLSHTNDAEVDFSGTQLSPSLNSHDMYPSEQTIGKDDVWSSRVNKKRELYLDDVTAAGVACTSSGIPSGVGRAIMNSVKGKRSERDREGKGNNGSRNGGPKIGRPVKTKAKLKQKTAQLSGSVNGPIGKFSDQPRATLYSSVQNTTVSEKDECRLLENVEEPLDLSHLQLPGMEDFGVGDDFGGQGEDIGSWLNIDDDVLQVDDDFMGLEIPMDDLTDLNMMV